tara:strand:- start:1670 stop:2002 length:333 start_codon:yes stop_codon:yes gene_type:complete
MITWKITNIEYIKEQDGLTNVAKNVHWYAYSYGDNGNFGNCWGNQQLDINELNPNTFTGFEDLTKEQVLGWVKESMGDRGVEAVENSINNNIESGDLGERSIGFPVSWTD